MQLRRHEAGRFGAQTALPALPALEVDVRHGRSARLPSGADVVCIELFIRHGGP